MNKKWKILVVNDDGIMAPGIQRLAANAAKFGEVWVAAPSGQCSGMSQKLTIFGEIPISSYDFPVPVRAAYSIGGTPADCVKIAITTLMPEKPDVVFSGINFGYNAGFDIAYSGTVGAAMEAQLNGVPAIAFSCQYGGSYEVTDRYLEEITRELLNRLPEKGEIWNVNFPGCPLEKLQGILRDRKIAPVCVFENSYEKTLREDGSEVLIPLAEVLEPDMAPPETDVHAVLHDFISIGTIACMVLQK